MLRAALCGRATLGRCAVLRLAGSTWSILINVYYRHAEVTVKYRGLFFERTLRFKGCNGADLASVFIPNFPHIDRALQHSIREIGVYQGYHGRKPLELSFLVRSYRS